jgi:hypothetical protein
VSACRANIAGFRKGIWVTQVVSRIDVVAAANPVSAVHDSNHGLGGSVQIDEMVRKRRYLDPELFETDEPLLQVIPRNVGQAQDLEPQRGTHGAFWHGAPGASRRPARRA